MGSERGDGAGQDLGWRLRRGPWLRSDPRGLRGDVMALFLGVDGGQSSTTALIGDESGRVLGTGEGGPCNHVGAAAGREKLLRAVSDSVAAAFRAADLDFRQARFEAACFGMS